MLPINFIVFCAILAIGNGIFVPPENATVRKLENVGIKTLGWQSGRQQQSPSLTVHHNYSKVYLHQSNEQPIRNISFNWTYTQQSNRTPKINSNIEDLENPNGQIQSQEGGHQQIIFDQNPNFTESRNLRRGINDHLGDFSNLDQQIAAQQTENVVDHFENIPSISGQNPNLGESRPFTNAHSGGYATSQRLRQDIRIKPQETKHPREKIEVLKKCPSGATGQFVYELSCNQFLNCWKGRGFVQNCAPGTWFNPETLECDYEEKVRCITGPRQASLREREPISEALQARCPRGFSGIIPHYSDCSKFITCNDGAEISMDCAPGTLFDIKSNMCDYPHKALCVGSDNIQLGSDGYSIQTSSPEKVVVIHGYNSNITYQIPTGNINVHLQGFNQLGGNGSGDRGSRFYQVGINDHLGEFSGGSIVSASHGNRNEWWGKTPVYIGMTQVSKPLDLSAVLSENGAGRGQSRPRGSTQSEQQGPKCPEGVSGLFPHPTACEKFLNCDHGRTFIQDCGPGTVFNTKFKVCDFPYNVECQTHDVIDEHEDIDRPNFSISPASSEINSMGLSENYCQNRVGFSIYADKCSRFLYCDSNRLYVGICSEYLLFNPKEGNCEENVDCGSFVSGFGGGLGQSQGAWDNWKVNTQYRYFRLVDVGAERYALALDDGFCLTNPGFSKHPSDSSKFFVCTDGKLLLGICNTDTFYNPATQSCGRGQASQPHFGRSSPDELSGGSQAQEDWEVNTQYQDFRLVDIGNEGYLLGLDRSYCQSNPGFSTHPRNSSKFLVCSNGRLFLGICNRNTYYNPSTQTCGRGQAPQPHFGRSTPDELSGGSQAREDWEVNTQYQRFRVVDIGNEGYLLGLDRNYCQSNPGFFTHPRNSSKFLVCTNGRLLLGICNRNTYYNPSTRTCGSGQGPQLPFGGKSPDEISVGSQAREDWEVNTQYQGFRLVDIGNEGYLLGLDRSYCQSNPGFSTHPRNSSKFLVCSNGRLLLGICNRNTYYNPLTQTCGSGQRSQLPSGQSSPDEGIGNTSPREDWQGNMQYQHFYLTNIGNEEHVLGLDGRLCQVNSGFAIHPKDPSKFLVCTNGKLLLGICNPNTYYNASTQNCGPRQGPRFSSDSDNPAGGTHGGLRPQDIWQLNTQYQHFYLTDIGNEGRLLGLDGRLCQVNSGFATHPKDPSKFLVCTNGRLLLGICNPNTYYNHATRTCASGQQSTNVYGGSQGNWQVDTQYELFRLVDIGNEAYLLRLSSGFCDINPGASVHPKNCSKFLLCTNGRLLLGICNANTPFYNPATKACERNYNCAHVQTPGTQTPIQQWKVNQRYEDFRLVEAGNEMMTLGLDLYYCQNNDGFIVHPKNCSRFLLCANHRLFLGICNPNSFYNPSTKTCQKNYNCGNVQPQGTQIPNQQWKVNQRYQDFRLVEAGNELMVLGLDMYYCQNGEGFTVHPKNCSRFLLCQNGRLFLGICHPRKFFNPSSKTCDVNFRCGQDNLDAIPKLQWENQQFALYSSGKTDLGLDGDYCKMNNGFRQHPEDCSKFLYCKNGILYVGVCKNNGIYNQTLQSCDFVSACAKQDAVADIYASCRGKTDGLYPHPNVCSKFINCQKRKASIHDCAAGTVFNARSKVCDFPHNVNCAVGDGAPKIDDKVYFAENHDNQWNQRNGSNQYSQNTNDEWNQRNQQGQNTNDQWNQPDQHNQNTDDQWDQHNQNTNDQWDQHNQNTNDQWDQHNQNTNDQWDQHNDQSNQNNNNQWTDQSNQNQQNLEFNGNQNQNNENWDQNQWNQNQNQQWTDQQSVWLTTQKPREKVIDDNELGLVVTYDQNKKPTNNWPPTFPTTDPNADYVFEMNDLVEVVVPEKPLKEVCQDTDFRCTKTTCIDPRRVCDGSVDCPDGEDEKNCEKYIEEFTHYPATKMAVKERAKYDNVTLTLCAKNCIESKGFTCKAFNFRKVDGACFLLTTNVGLSGSLFRLPTYDYYENANYTIECKYKCTNQKCVEEHQICNGIDDCFDRYDEKGCTAEELGYSVRLVGSNKNYEGAVEVTVLGKTGYVCDDMFNLEAANVLCKELGFKLGAADFKRNSYFGQNLTTNETFFMMDDIVCDGEEVSIRDCDFSGWGVSNCMDKEILGVICKTPEELCTSEMWRCKTVNECIPLTFLCDGVEEDCSDNSDEDSEYCDAPLEMRLVGGKTEFEGRVEIKHHGTWGTICDDDFNDDAGKVICKSLGYAGPAHVVKEAHFGQGSGPIWLDQVFCHGNESSLEDCIKWDWGVHNCDHGEDVGVICDDYVNAGSPRHLLEVKPTETLDPKRCGYRNDDIFLDNNEVHFRVIKGSLATKGHYPWQASLRVKGKSAPSHWCGGVVISEKFVLTAAHCLHGVTKGAYVVVAGDYDVNTEEGTEQQVFIDEFYIHENFRKGTKMNNDIALIRLKGNGFNITRDVQPICLPDADFADEAGLNCTISGFGSIQTGKAVASKELRAGWIPIQPTEVCKMPHIYGRTITEGMLCAGPLDGGVDACDGDSGGPLACLHNGLFTLVGMTSWGQHCGEANKPGVYVKIAHYRNWIDETIKKHQG